MVQNHDDIIKEEGQETTTLPKRQKKVWWRSVLKWLGITIASVILLLVLLTMLLYIPAVQNWVVGVASTEVSKATGLDLEIGRVRVKFPLKLKIEDVSAVNQVTGKPVVEVSLLTADVGVLPILKGGNVPISKVLLEQAKADLLLSNDSIHIVGAIGKASLNAMDIDLATMSMDAQDLVLHDADVLVTILTDTVQKPKADKSEMVITFASADVRNVSARIWVYPDSMEIASYISKGVLRGGEVNIKEEYYQAKEVDIVAGMTALGEPMEMLPMPWYAEARGKDVRYGGANDIRGDISHLHYTVGEEVVLNEGRFKAAKNESRFVVRDLELAVGDTQLKGWADLPFEEWLPDSVGMVDFHLEGDFNLADVKRFLGDSSSLPNQPFALDLTANGAMDGQLKYAVKLFDEGVLDLDLKGMAFDAMSETRRVDATFGIVSGGELRETLVAMLGTRDATWDIPAGVHVDGSASYLPQEVKADFRVSSEGRYGEFRGKAYYRPKSKEYYADMRVNGFELQPFLPNDTIGPLTATLNLEGRGVDLFSPQSRAILYLNVDSMSYRQHALSNVMLLSQLKENQLFGAINSDNEDLKMVAQTDILLKRDSVSGSINVLVDTIVPKAIGLQLPILESGKLELRSMVFSNLQEVYHFRGEIENFVLVTDKGKIYPKNSYITVDTSERDMAAEVASGDLSLKFKAKNGLNDFTARIKKVLEEVKKSMGDSIGQVNMAPWIHHYPDMELSFEMGRDNLLRTYLDEHRIGATSVSLDLKTFKDVGLNGLGVVSHFQADTFKIDNIDLVLRQDSTFFTAMGTVHKEHFRNQPAFDIILSLSSNVMRSEAYVNWLDSEEREFVRMGIELFNRPNGDLTFGFTPDPVVLAYNRFEVVEDDYVTLPKGDRQKVLANVLLSTNEGTSIKINNLPDERGHLLRAAIKNLHLSELEGIPMVPDLSGRLKTTVDWLQLSKEQSRFDADLRVDNLFYNKKELGQIHTIASADLDKNGTDIAGEVMMEGSHIIDLRAYAPSKEKGLRYSVSVSNLQLQKLNPFLPSKYAQVKGGFNGVLSNYDLRKDIAVSPRLPLSGELVFRDASLYTPYANETYILDDKPIKVVDDKVLFNQYALMANKGSLITSGYVSLSSTLMTDLSIVGRDVLLLNSKGTNKTIIYGRVNTDADIRIRGPLSAFELNGNISIKGDTDVTYQSQSGELQNRAGYKDLVTFTDFSDTLFVKQKGVVDSLSLGGMSIKMGIHIDPATKVNAILTADGNNKGSLQGGGDFNISIPAYGSMTLNGTYNIQEGDIHIYISPISRRFKVRQGSKVTWNGLLMEPDIDVVATANLRSNVSMPGESPRQVDFNVNVIAENRLDNLRLRFETEAPQDLSIRNILARLSPEEQNRQSIMLLATGHFLGSGASANTRGFDMNSALSSFLASQINSIAGEALDAEINLGISDGTNAYGVGTNYSYTFTKRLFNNRISVQVGGKMVTGAAAAGLQQTFIDNMSLDYQLDQAGTHYLRLFHNKNYENLLDGEVVETGIGYVIRRKMNSMGELFKFPNPFTSDLPTPRAIWEFKAIPPKNTSAEENNNEPTE